MSLRIALIVFGGIVVLIVAFALFIPRANRVGEVAPKSDQTASSTPSVMIHDTIANGIHTISGSVLLPNPCTTLSASAEVATDTPQVITVLLSAPHDSGVCLEVPTSEIFSVTAAASTTASIEATVNGVPAEITRH